MPERKTSGIFLSDAEFRAQAVYSDETMQFRSPVEPLSTDEVTVRLRAGQGTFSAVFLCTAEREYLMEEEENDGIFQYYSVVLPPTEKKISYVFRLQYGEAEAFYTKYGYAE